MGIHINVVYWSLRNLFIPSIYSIYHFHNVNMLIFVSNNIIIASVFFGVGRT